MECLLCATDNGIGWTVLRTLDEVWSVMGVTFHIE